LAHLLICNSDRDSLAAAGLLLGAGEGTVTFRVVASLPEMSRLLHDLRRVYTRISICGVPPAESGSMHSALTVLQARGTRVEWFDSHELLWTTSLRSQLEQLEVEFRLPDAHRPETERTSGLVLVHLLDGGDTRAGGRERDLRSAVSQLRSVDIGGPDWVALLDAVGHDHRLVANRVVRSAVARVWEPESAMDEAERRLVALQRSREDRVRRFVAAIEADAEYGQELLRFDVDSYSGLRYVRPRMYTEAARRATGAEYAQARVAQGWTFACRDQYRAGLDVSVAFMEQLADLDVSVHGYPYQATAQYNGGANVDARLMKALEASLEEERSGRRRMPAFPMPDEEDW
jgi:hypothetical protein